MTDEFLGEAQTAENLKRPKKTEIRDVKGKLIQTEEISDDGRIVVTKTNVDGL